MGRIKWNNLGWFKFRVSKTQYHKQMFIMLGFMSVLAVVSRFMNHSDIMSGDVKEGLDAPGDHSRIAGFFSIVVFVLCCILVMVRIKINWGGGVALYLEDDVLKWGVLGAIWSITIAILMFIYPSGDSNRNVHMYGGIVTIVSAFMLVGANDLYIENKDWDSPIYNTLRWFYPIAVLSFGYWYWLILYTDIIKDDGTVADPQWWSIVKIFAPLVVFPVIVFVFSKIFTSTT
jgi:hypothetical protein